MGSQPKVILLMALTLDGKIGKSPDHFPDWTGKEDKKLFVELSREAGVVIMGSKTFDTMGKPLAGRKNIILTRDKSRTSQWANLVFTDQSPQQVLDDLGRQGFERVILAGGALVNSLFAQEQLIDEIIVTITPKVFGYGLSLFSEEISLELNLIDVKKLGTDLVYLRYKVLKAAV